MVRDPSLENEKWRRGKCYSRWRRQRGFVFWRPSLREEAGISSEMLHFTPIFTPFFQASSPFSYFCVAFFDLWLYTCSSAFRAVIWTSDAVTPWPTGLVVTRACPFHHQNRINSTVHLCLPITTTHVMREDKYHFALYVCIWLCTGDISKLSRWSPGAPALWVLSQMQDVLLWQWAAGLVRGVTFPVSTCGKNTRFYFQLVW